MSSVAKMAQLLPGSVGKQERGREGEREEDGEREGASVCEEFERNAMASLLVFVSESLREKPSLSFLLSLPN